MQRRGFARADLLAVFILGVLLGVIAMVATPTARARDLARSARCLLNQRAMYAMTDVFASDHRGQVPMVPWYDPNARRPPDALSAPLREALQYSRGWVVDAFERHLGVRPTPMPEDWLPQATHWHLRLMEYMAPHEVMERSVCPSHPVLGGRSPVWGYDSSRPLPPMASSRTSHLVRLSSLGLRTTYEMVPTFYGRNSQAYRRSPVMEQGDGLYEYRVPLFGALSLMTTVEPMTSSPNKVLFFEPMDRHRADSPIPYSHPDAQPFATFMDGSTRSVSMDEASHSMRTAHDFGGQYYMWTGASRRSGPFGRTSRSETAYPAIFRWTEGSFRGADIGDRRPERPPGDGEGRSNFVVLKVGSESE